MKLIKTTSLTGHNRSCVPCALSVVLEKPYEEVNNWLKYKGYRRGDNWGTRTHMIQLSKLNLIKQDHTSPSVGQFVTTHPTGTFFILVNGHGLTVKNGIAYDTQSSEKCKVKQVYELQGGIKLPDDWDWAQDVYKRKAQYELDKQKKIEQEKKRKQYYKKHRKVIKAKKTTIEFKVEALLKRKKSWESKLKRAKTTLQTIERKLKYYQRKQNTQ